MASPGIGSLQFAHQQPKPVELVLVIFTAGLDDYKVLESSGGRQRIVRLRKTDRGGATDPNIVNAQQLIEACRRSSELRARHRPIRATPDWMHDADRESAFEGVDNERGEEFRVDGFRYDKKRFAGAGSSFHQREPRCEGCLGGFVADHDATMPQPNGPWR